MAENMTTTGARDAYRDTLTHVDEKGDVRMVDVSDKIPTKRVAKAEGTILMHPETQAMVLQDKAEKGDVLACEPEVILCDEATSALDPSSTNTILKLLRDINRETGVTLVVITHSMDVVEKICNNVAVLDAGRVVEQGSVAEVFAAPQAAATRVLLGKVDWDA